MPGPNRPALLTLPVIGRREPLAYSDVGLQRHIDTLHAAPGVEVSAATTLDKLKHRYVNVDTSGAAVTVTLPLNSINSGALFTVRCDGANNTTVAVSGSDTIEGNTSWVLADRHTLTVLSVGDNEWKVVESSNPYAHVYRSSNQSIANATVTTVNWNADKVDALDWHSTSTNTDRVTVDRPGLYRVEMQARFASNSTGIRQAYLMEDGVQITRVNANAVGSATPTSLQIVTVRAAANGKYFGGQVHQNSGGALDLVGGSSVTDSYLIVTRLGDA